MKWLRLNIFYEGIMIVLIVVSLIALMSDGDSNFKYVHKIIWYIFLVDVSVRFIRATVKWKYVKNNTFDIVSIIPLEDIFLLARFSRFLKLFRYKNLVKRYLDKVSEIIEKVGFLRVTISLVLLNVIISVLLILITDLGIIGSSLWVWSNFLKFNYESNLEGFILLSVAIKIIGVMYMGILLSEVVSVLKRWYEKYKKSRKVIATKDQEQSN